MRIEHSQDWLNHAMYGREASPPELPVADYKLAVHLPNKHSLYTFCMCPGGEVVAASSEQHRLVVNGMSNYARNGRNANSALLVGVSAAELQDSHPLAGMRFQQKLEKLHFKLAAAIIMHQFAVLAIFCKNTPRLVAEKLNQRISRVSIGFHQMNIYRHLLQKLCDLEFQP